MRHVFALLLVFSFAALEVAGQNAPRIAPPGNSRGGPFDPKDLSGYWDWNTGQRRIGPNRPPLTTKGREILEGRISADAAPNAALSNDPRYECNPQGWPRLIFDNEPIEFIQQPDRLIMLFQWEHTLREVWLDGRALPSGENLENLGPAFYGHSVGRWEGDTLVVDTVGLDDRPWLDGNGNPKSFKARVEEKWKRVDADTLELRLNFYDPENYTEPWIGENDPKIFKRIPNNFADLNSFGWFGLFSGNTEQLCAPMNEVEAYNKRFRDPAAFGGAIGR